MAPLRTALGVHKSNTHTNTRMDSVLFCPKANLGGVQRSWHRYASLDIYNCVTWYRPASVHENNTTTKNNKMNNVLFSPKANCGSVQLSWHRYELPL